MPKKYSTTTTLVIVESPAKCKKIEEYLGPGYKCIATYGHLRELSSLKDIDIENNFTPTYTIINNEIKKKQIELIKKEIKKANEVILALDGDREGEKISFCVAQIYNLDITKTKRITFNEITETAIQTALKNPRKINMDLVNAQQARQILDILVGFKVSPILWKCILQNKKNALSAGRCQTPALRLIYDNEEDIKSCEERKVYNITGYFTNLNIAFDLNPQDKYDTEEKVIDFLSGSADFSHIYTCSEPVKIFKNPPEPFTTSRLQQTASNEFHYSPKETMRICQQLYEGGYITYMRTDSKKYSREFINHVKTYIINNYTEGNKYINENIDDMTTNSLVDDDNKINNKDQNLKNETKKNETKKTIVNNNLCQEAHEAIRPTNISLKELPEKFDSKERKMYKLIWETTLESCMNPASFYTITANITSFQDTEFNCKSELIDFPGWKIVTKKYSTDNKEYNYLKQMKQNATILYKKISSRVTIKGLKQHYTEARLIHLLEEKGIGRPSTFSSLVDKIQERNYVKKEDVKGKEILCKDYELENGEIFEIETKREFGNEKNKLIIQPLGKIVIEFIDKYFIDLFNYDYTKYMEDSLDKISKGEMEWFELCSKCNSQLDFTINNLDIDKKMEYKIDENNTYIVGKYGPVIKSIEEIDGKEEIKFKSIRKDVDIKTIENGNCNVEDIIDTNKSVKSQYILGQHNCKDVILRKGKFGLYISWDNNSKTLKELGNRPIENITFDEIKVYLEEGSKIIREINSNMSIRKGPKGDYLFYKTPRMKKPEFKDIKGFTTETNNDYKICNINILKSWINEKYNI
jgi:DNA topoisomerase-1